MMIHELQHEMALDNHSQQLKKMHRKRMTREQRQYTTEPQAILDILRWHVVIDRVILKGRCIVIPHIFQKQALEQLHINHMAMKKKTKLLACELIYYPCIESNIKKYINSCSTCLEFQQMQPKKGIMHHKITRKPWKVVEADMFTLHKKNYLCIVDYVSKFPVIKKTEDLLSDSLILACKIIIFE